MAAPIHVVDGFGGVHAGPDLRAVVTYDSRMAGGAAALGMIVEAAA